ncbi:MAG: CbtB-domain containing protein [Gammaproteobacteria bacterium]|nr:CbtB-domain containing protein [Gammaproteobacteria bacterium]
MTSQVSTHKTIRVKASTSACAQSLAALVFGLIIFFAVGFAPMGVAHNAAHDVRHSAAFPCH